MEDDPRADTRTPAEIHSATVTEELELCNDAESLVKLNDESHPAAGLARDVYRRLLRKFTSWGELSGAGRAAWVAWRGSDPLAVLKPITTPVGELNPAAWPDGSNPEPAA